MFDDVTKREGGKRAARRIRYLVGSSALQVALVAGIISLSAAISAKVVEGPLVPVKIVRPAAPPPAPPPPAPPRPKSAPKPHVPKPRPPSPTAMIQPKETPAELKPPEPAPEPEDEGEGVEGGVIGGVVGGVPAPPVEPPAGPVKFNTTMTPPVAVAGPPLEYTQQALEHEVEGVMVVECVVTVDGKVHACRVLKSLPFMDQAVVQNLEHRRYKPATLAGRPLDVQYTFTIRLRLPQ